MTTYWVLILAVVVVAAVILLISTRSSEKSGSAAEKAEERSTGYKPPTSSTAWKAEKSVPEKPVTFKKPPEKPLKPPVTPPPKPPVKPEPVVVKMHTTVYEYTPTRGVVRCRVCDGENPHGSAICSICGNYLND